MSTAYIDFESKTFIQKRSGLRKIKDNKPCLSPEHDPPTHIVLEPGIYEHVCPSCGKRTVFEVPYIY